jgi:hypothetical protein
MCAINLDSLVPVAAGWRALADEPSKGAAPWPECLRSGRGRLASAEIRADKMGRPGVWPETSISISFFSSFLGARACVSGRRLAPPA